MPHVQGVEHAVNFPHVTEELKTYPDAIHMYDQSANVRTYLQPLRYETVKPVHADRLKMPDVDKGES